LEQGGALENWGLGPNKNVGWGGGGGGLGGGGGGVVRGGLLYCGWRGGGFISAG